MKDEKTVFFLRKLRGKLAGRKSFLKNDKRLENRWRRKWGDQPMVWEFYRRTGALDEVEHCLIYIREALKEAHL